MENIESKIINCIKKAHSFSSSLGDSSSILRDYIVNNLASFSSTDIHVELLKLNEKGIIKYDSESGLITEISLPQTSS